MKCTFDKSTTLNRKKRKGKKENKTRKRGIFIAPFGALLFGKILGPSRCGELCLISVSVAYYMISRAMNTLLDPTH